jgi:hypothetical protein
MAHVQVLTLKQGLFAAKAKWTFEKILLPKSSLLGAPSGGGFNFGPSNRATKVSLNACTGENSCKKFF